MELTVVFATQNAGKMKEINEIMKGSSLCAVSMRDLNMDAEIIEDGETFLDNALIKAKKVAELTGMPAMAEDSGLEVDHLNGRPGVLSARFMGKDTPYDIKNQKILTMLKGVPFERRTARFKCAAVFIDTDGQILSAEASLTGVIAHEAAGDNGFGYDPILYIPELSKTSAQLSVAEKNVVSHRGKALRSLIKQIEDKYTI